MSNVCTHFKSGIRVSISQTAEFLAQCVKCIIFSCLQIQQCDCSSQHQTFFQVLGANLTLKLQTRSLIVKYGRLYSSINDSIYFNSLINCAKVSQQMTPNRKMQNTLRTLQARIFQYDKLRWQCTKVIIIVQRALSLREQCIKIAETTIQLLSLLVTIQQFNISVTFNKKIKQIRQNLLRYFKKYYQTQIEFHVHCGRREKRLNLVQWWALEMLF
ncbi:Hypothetical_protein [Hexamita inflata]|uniref:Hypothetical_protein n=1 Tax=Hexamita inflata TaxID=28002 RepID=A0AA86PDA2_9EUKA|nr:Hypothetical protein HINF_LOCUS24088 [Hexamita inflata]